MNVILLGYALLVLGWLIAAVFSVWVFVKIYKFYRELKRENDEYNHERL